MDKLTKHLDISNISKIIWAENNIEFYGCSLPYIFTSLENGINIFIEANLENTNKYKMMVPRNNIDNMITYFRDECGIDFIEEESNVEITKILFADLK